jgi:hypothetical protein
LLKLLIRASSGSGPCGEPNSIIILGIGSPSSSMMLVHHQLQLLQASPMLLIVEYRWKYMHSNCWLQMLIAVNKGETELAKG